MCSGSTSTPDQCPEKEGADLGCDEMDAATVPPALISVSTQLIATIQIGSISGDPALRLQEVTVRPCITLSLSG